ncbi:hypothetical protein IEC97_07455 [Neobacillus cucumis]|uniref:hypothetical protein n=1 Tax=Neobacillus cucumis TaxID=1740721 RepID=UPI0018DFC969|nr:hypothetical protein [Neobacillus cucumis]MBI0577194.1 hypothetical protein [Neobacillus cucumis]
MSENENKKNKSIFGDNLNLEGLFNNTLQPNSNNDALMNLAGTLMQNPNTMNSLMKVASSLFTNDTMANTVNETSKPKQDDPVPSQKKTELSVIISQLEKLSNELAEMKAQLNEYKEHNKMLIEYILNSDKNTKKK